MKENYVRKTDLNIRTGQVIQITANGGIEPITVDGIIRTLKETKNGKAAGPENLPIELVKTDSI